MLIPKNRHLGQSVLLHSAQIYLRYSYQGNSKACYSLISVDCLMAKIRKNWCKSKHALELCLPLATEREHHIYKVQDKPYSYSKAYKCLFWIQVLLFLFETQELRLGVYSAWVAQSATVQNQAVTQPSVSLLLASCNRVSSILCSVRPTAVPALLCPHPAWYSSDWRLMMTGWLLTGTVWIQKWKRRKK